MPKETQSNSEKVVAILNPETDNEAKKSVSEKAATPEIKVNPAPAILKDTPTSKVVSPSNNVEIRSNERHVVDIPYFYEHAMRSSSLIGYGVIVLPRECLESPTVQDLIAKKIISVQDSE